jgi:hypothetical protein
MSNRLRKKPRADVILSGAKYLALPAQGKLREESAEMDPRLRGGDDEKGRRVPPEPSFPRKRESTWVARIRLPVFVPNQGEMLCCAQHDRYPFPAAS